MPITLYYNILSAPARTALLTARYLNVPDITVKDVNLLKGETRTPEYLALNPNHAVPVLVDGDFSLFESRAIATYLANQYAPGNAVYPAEPKARAQMPLIMQQEAPQAALDELKEKTTVLETLLGEGPFFTGSQLTLADISLSTAMLFLGQFIPSLFTGKLLAWYERMETAIPLLKELHDEVKKNPAFAKRQ